MDDALAACRALHFTASLTLFGVLIFQVFLAPDPLRDALSRPLGRLVASSGVVAGFASLIWLAMVSAATSGSWNAAIAPRSIVTILADTEFGAVWRWHVALSVGLAALGLVGPTRLGRFYWLVGAAVSTLQLVTLGLVGHAAGLGTTGRIAQSLHLLTAGFWLGSLPPVVLCLRIDALSPLRRQAMLALTRFSNVGHASVALVVTTGLVDMGLITGKLTLDLAIPYQRLLVVKIVIVAAMIALAITNRYWLVPRLRQDAATLDRIRRICIVVFCLGLAAIGLVSVFGMLSPT